MPKGDHDQRKRAKLIDALASGQNVSAAAEHAGYTRRHAHRIMDQLKDEIERRKLELCPDGPDEAKAIVDEVVASLRALVKDADRDADKIAAGKALINLYLPRVKANAQAAQTTPDEPKAPTGDTLTSDEVAARLRIG